MADEYNPEALEEGEEGADEWTVRGRGAVRRAAAARGAARALELATRHNPARHAALRCGGRNTKHAAAATSRPQYEPSKQAVMILVEAAPGMLEAAPGDDMDEVRRARAVHVLCPASVVLGGCCRDWRA